MEIFNEEAIRSALIGLSHRGRVVFSAAISARLLPNFSEFERVAGVGPSPLLNETLAVVWRWVDGAEVTTRRLRRLAESSESLAPDPGEYETVLASSALDAAVAVANTVRLVLDDDLELAVEVACQARDSVDMFVQEVEDMSERGSSLEERIALHPLMLSEVAFQTGLLSSLAKEGPDGCDSRLREPVTSNLGFSREVPGSII